MAFLPPSQTQDPNQQNQQIPIAPALAPAGGGTPSGGTGSAGPSSASPGSAPQQPWQNITTYLQANGPQAGALANNLASGLTSGYNDLTGQLSQANTDFTKSVNDATVKENPDLISSAVSSPTAFVKNPDNVAEFQKELNANYAGPSSFSTSPAFATLQGNILKGQTNANLAKTDTGIQTLLGKSEGPNQTAGVHALDSLLLNENPDYASILQGAAAPYAGLTGQLDTTQAALDLLANQGAQTTAATGADVNARMTGPGGAIPNFSNAMSQKVQDASKKATSYNQEIADVISKLASGQALDQQQAYDTDPSGTLSTLNPYGTSTGVFQNMLAEGFAGPGALQSYFSPHNQIAMPTLGGVQTSDDYATAQALNQLMGTDLGLSAPPGQPFSIPKGIGSYDSHGALQGLYDTLGGLNTSGALPYMSDEQLASYIADNKALASYLGLPGNDSQPPIAPIGPPQTGLGPGGGPPFLQPPNPVPPSGGGGFHTF